MCSTPPGESLFTFGLTLPGSNGDEERRITFYHMFVDENFLEALGVEVHDGRFFNADVPGDSLNSFVVNQAGAEAIHDSLMTRQIEIPNIYTGTRSSKTVVGIIDDFHFASFHTTVEPLILEYNPMYARYLLVRFHPSHAKAVIETLDRMWRVDAPRLPLNYYFLDESFGKFYATEQRTKQIVIIVAMLAVCLASLGIFGTSLFAIQQRTKEIGVRKLLGSATSVLFILLFRLIFMIFFVACAVGVPIALWVGEQWLAGYPYRTNFSITILLISFTTILVVMLLTVSSYLFKIGRVQPAEVLKSQ
jgi:putative ABC transport system permease protein